MVPLATESHHISSQRPEHTTPLPEAIPQRQVLAHFPITSRTGSNLSQPVVFLFTSSEILRTRLWTDRVHLGVVLRCNGLSALEAGAAPALSRAGAITGQSSAHRIGRSIIVQGRTSVNKIDAQNLCCLGVDLPVLPRPPLGALVSQPCIQLGRSMDAGVPQRTLSSGTKEAALGLGVCSWRAANGRRARRFRAFFEDIGETSGHHVAGWEGRACRRGGGGGRAAGGGGRRWVHRLFPVGGAFVVSRGVHGRCSAAGDGPLLRRSWG